MQLNAFPFSRRSGEVESGRIFWSSLGDILETLPFLPFTVNVPDTLSSMWSFFTSFLPGSSGNKKPVDNSTALRITGEDIMDYFLFWERTYPEIHCRIQVTLLWADEESVVTAKHLWSQRNLLNTFWFCWGYQKYFELSYFERVWVDHYSVINSYLFI